MFLEEDLPNGYDVILLSHIIGSLGIKKTRTLLRKAYNSLPDKDSVIIINEWYLNNEKTGPIHSSLMGLNNILEGFERGAYSFSEISKMLSEVGFVDIEIRPLSTRAEIIIGYKRRY